MMDRIAEEPYRFEFFQAVRLLEREMQRLAGRPGSGSTRHADAVGLPSQSLLRVGRHGPATREDVRFVSDISLGFPASQIAQAQRLADDTVREFDDDDQHDPRLRLFVTFLGLAGANGVLPDHYTSLIIHRLRAKDRSLRDFLDVFNHRLISLFYRAWEKHRLPTLIEAARLYGEADLPSQILFSLVGLGTKGLRDRCDYSDDLHAYFSGHFSNQRPTSASLGSILSKGMGIPVAVSQFSGRWLYLDRENQTRIGGLRERLGNRTGISPGGLGQHQILGKSTVLGDRVWDVQSKFTLSAGPLDQSEFYRLMPSGSALKPLGELTRSYVGVEFDFDVAAKLKPGECPRLQLGAPATNTTEITKTDQSSNANKNPGPRLGWNTWLHSQTPDRVIEDAVFQLKE